MTCQVVMFATVFFLLFLISLSQANPNQDIWSDKGGQDVGPIARKENNITVEITTSYYMNPQYTPAVLHGTVTNNSVKLANEQVLFRFIEGPRKGRVDAVFTSVTQPLGFINALFIFITDIIGIERLVLQWKDSNTGLVYTSQPITIETVPQPKPLPSIGCDNCNPNYHSSNSGSDCLHCLQLVAFPYFKTRRIGDQTGFGAWIQDQNKFRNCNAMIVFKIIEAADPNRVGTQFMASANPNIGCIAQYEFIVTTCGEEKVVAQYTDVQTGNTITSQPLSARTIDCND